MAEYRLVGCPALAKAHLLAGCWCSHVGRIRRGICMAGKQEFSKPVQVVMRILQADNSGNELDV